MEKWMIFNQEFKINRDNAKPHGIFDSLEKLLASRIHGVYDDMYFVRAKISKKKITYLDIYYKYDFHKDRFTNCVEPCMAYIHPKGKDQVYIGDFSCQYCKNCLQYRQLDMWIICLKIDQARNGILLPCPFCGGKVQVEVLFDRYRQKIDNAKFKIQCTCSAVEITGGNKIDVIKQWNKRIYGSN